MKKIVIMLLLASPLLKAQELPKVVESAFNEQFPNTEISSWKDNNKYKPLTTDVLYPTDDMDGATAIKRNQVPEESKELGLKDPQAPTEYYVFFTKDSIQWESTFKRNGQFVIAKGKVDEVPKTVSDAIDDVFKGKPVKIVDDIQKVIVPSSDTAIYRVFVKPKKGKKRILKVNENGNVLSNLKK